MAADPEHAFSRIYEEFSAAFDALDGRGLDFQRNLPETRLAVGLVARVDIANDDSRANSWAATTPEETLTQGLHGSLRDPRRKVTDAWRRGLKELTAKTPRSEEHTSELQSLMRISYAVFCLKKKKNK